MFLDMFSKVTEGKWKDEHKIKGQFYKYGLNPIRV